MKPKIVQAVNQQIAAEFNSAYIYLGMAAYADSINLKGFANWFKIQFKEELDHAAGLHSHLVERGAKLSLSALPAPADSYQSIAAAAAATLKHEQLITTKISSLYELAQKEKDHALASFLQWYISEQVEEEANATQLVDKLAIVGDTPTALYLLDQELLVRKYTPSSILGHNGG